MGILFLPLPMCIHPRILLDDQAYIFRDTRRNAFSVFQGGLPGRNIERRTEKASVNIDMKQRLYK